MRICRTCHVPKPLTAFYKHSRCREGRAWSCIVCTLEYLRENKRLKREAIRDYMRRYDRLPHRVAAKRAYDKTPRGREVRRVMQRVYRAFRRASNPPARQQA